MTTVHISASREYDVLIERGLIDRIGEETRKLSAKGRAVVVSGETVFPLYGPRVVFSLEQAGFDVLTFIHPSGESAKSLSVYGKLLNFLCSSHISSTDSLFALGGGVTGDLTGFAAATYLRGIKYIQIPTTLLAAVDSSVGGKTAINLDSAKNQAGCFYQPAAVFCDCDTLSSLPPEQYRCGCAEIIKYGILGDRSLFHSISETPIKLREESVISRCVEIKSQIVNEDEFDKGKRRLLNLGHTFAHAIEKNSAFSITHGDAVAIGTAVIARAAVQMNICSEETCNSIISLLRQYDLPTETSYTVPQLLEAVQSDKKIAGGKLHLIVPEEIGQCRIIPVQPDEIPRWMACGGIRTE